MTQGSQQLRLFRRCLRDGLSIDHASVVAGISVGEARLIAADDLRNPPAADEFQLLGNAEILLTLCSAWGRV